MGTYLINNVRMRDGVPNREGLSRLKRTVEEYGGTWLSHSGEPSVDDARGSSSPILVEFGTMTEAQNWYNSSEGILYTLGILGGLIGPLFGVLIAGYYLVSKQKVWVDDMFVMTTTGRYWFRNGWNPNAVAAVIIGGIPAIAIVLISGTLFAKSDNALLSHGGDFSWFVGCGLGLLAFWLLEKNNPRITRLEENAALATDGTGH